MFEENEQGRQGFRLDDSGSGDALAMGMDVDIPAATTSGDRREAERRRGREGRYSKSGSIDFLTGYQLGKSLHLVQTSSL